MTSRKGLILGLVLAGLVSTGAAEETKAPAAFASLVDQILAFFPSLIAEIIEAKDKEVTLSVGRRQGIQAGMEFSLFRQGRELRHPKTGEALGRVEQELGFAVVSQVSETHSVATVTSGAGIHSGDRARISGGTIKLTVTALGSPGVSAGLVEAVVSEVSEELSATGRFQVINGDALAAAVTQARVPPERVLQGEGLAEPAGRYRVSRLLVLWIKQVEVKPFVEARLFSFLPGRETTPMAATGLFVPSSVKAPPVTASREQFSSAPQANPPVQQTQPGSRSFLSRLFFGEEERQSDFAGSISMPLREVARLDFPVLAMDVAVSPKDRVSRLVATDGEKIYLYRIVERALELEWTYAGHVSGTVLSVQLADLNEDGVLEVVANRYSPLPTVGLSSFILTSTEGKPSVVVQDFPQILFAVDATGDGVKRTLWGQRFDPDNFFTHGRVERYVLRNGRLVVDGSVRVPRDFRVTGATFSNIAGAGSRALAYVDERGRLVISIEGKEKWHSISRVGGAGYVQLEVLKGKDRAGQNLFYSVEPMPLVVDLDGDGVDEILVPQNEVQGTLAVVSGGAAGYRVYTLDTGFEEPISGLGAIRGATAPILILASVHFTSILRKSGETRILVTTRE
ncbi:MAG: hypothetical protein HY215_07640 [Candidatus Rokubacteria bacterium]|nr:hypothetical protein [Candidatus Rokubacteria bacterium]